jgi:hypothetical protein
LSARPVSIEGFAYAFAQVVLQALAGIMKDADVLEEKLRVAAYRDVVNNSDSGSALQRQAEEKLKAAVQLEPVRPTKTEIAAFVARFGTHAPT